jgi:Transposase DDE domain group 1
MRYNKTQLIARRTKVLPIKFVQQDMTTYSGLALVDHVLRLYRLQARLKETFKTYQLSGDYHIGDILFVLVVMLLVGAERLQHIDYLRSDPLFCRVVRLTRIPHRTKISTALKQFASDSLKALIELNGQLVIEKLQSLGLLEVTIDLDGTVVSTKGHPTWAFKGYNPIKRGAPSYFPLTAHVAETGHFLTIWNRPGNVHDSKRALELIQRIRKQLPMFSIRFRADSAFCVPQVINYLLHHYLSFAIKAPFWKLLALKTAAEKRKIWYSVNETWSYFWLKSPIDSLEEEHYVFIFRKKVKELGTNFQLDLFSPNNGVYEYSAVVTDTKQWDAKELLLFVSGRSGQENSLSELKDDFAFGYVPTNTYQANSAYFQISQMAYNLSLSLQHEMGLVKKHPTNPKRTRFYQGWKWKTFRFLILNRAGRIGWEQGTRVLYLTFNKATKQLYDRIGNTLNNPTKKAA